MKTFLIHPNPNRTKVLLLMLPCSSEVILPTKSKYHSIISIPLGWFKKWPKLGNCHNHWSFLQTNISKLKVDIWEVLIIKILLFIYPMCLCPIHISQVYIYSMITYFVTVTYMIVFKYFKNYLKVPSILMGDISIIIWTTN